MTENPQKCQKCGRPVAPEMKFCESCGAKIEALPACPKCGAPLAPDRKFCETCGAPVIPAAAPPTAKPAEVVLETAPVSSVPKPAPVQKTPPPSEPQVDEIQIEAAVAAAVDTWTGPDPVAGETVVPKKAGQKKPVPQTTMIIAGILVLALLGAAAYFVVLPMLSGPATPAQNQQVIPGTTNAGSSPGTPATTVDSGQAGTASLTAGPTQIPPSNRVVIVDAERDPISSQVTVTFKGGAGQYGVREILVSLTRSDGSVLTKTFKPDTIGSGITLQGTAKTDRVEVTTYFYTGEQYKILDQIFEYKKRGG
ncbi:MAG: zinc ribbon domain-containing protein [Methanoregulaceae archaeon]|nr:MAG: zinc ribbon domain-containing protein [Methanoregulaceae archaeon]